MIRTSNPALSKDIFNKAQSRAYAQGETMTLQGAINKSLMMLALVLVGAIYTWRLFFDATTPEAGANAVTSWMAIGGIGGFITALVTIFKRSWSALTAPVYAVLEGLFLGAISAFFEAQYPGLVMQAVALTIGTLLVMLLAYKTGLIKVTQKFRMGVVAATGAIALVYMMSWILSMFGVQSHIMTSSGGIGIVISLVVVVVAALNLVLDFDFMDKGSQAGLPKYMEWYAAFGLMVTLVWLYLEMLRLLSRLSRN